MHGIGLLNGIKVIPVAAGDEVDTANFEGVIFLNEFNAAADTNTMTANHGDLANGSDQAATTAVLTMDATATLGALQVHKPTKRFISCTLNGVSGNMYAILYAGRTKPAVQTSATNKLEAISPLSA